MNVNNIFIPLIILTDYESYRVILKKYNEKLGKCSFSTEKDKVINHYIKEIESWHRNVMKRSIFILVISCFLFCIAHMIFELKYNDYLISILILIYIICFIIEKYRNKESIMQEIQDYASKQDFVNLGDIFVF